MQFDVSADRVRKDLTYEFTTQAVQRLVTLYGLREVKPFGNCAQSWEHTLPHPADVHRTLNIKIDVYPHFPLWANVDIAFGEVRHIWANRTPMGEFGIASASSQFTIGMEPCGQAIPGYDLQGLKWRVSAVAPKGRTHIVSVGDKYIVTENIIAHMITLMPQIETAKNVPDLMFDKAWDKAKSGW